MIRYLVFAYLILSSCVHSTEVIYSSNCIEKRGAWDFGSGTIKFKAAKVDVCEKKIISDLYYKDESVSFKEDLSRSKENKFSETVQKEALNFIEEVLKETHHLKLKAHKGVATAAFREAKNAQAALDKLNGQYDLNVKVITQDEEALLGVISAGTKKLGSVESYTVWDIGGGSQQITQKINATQKSHNNDLKKTASKSKTYKYKTYKSQWAAVSFKNWVVKNIKKKASQNSPNPLNVDEFARATLQAQALAKDFKLPKQNFNNPKSPSALVYGIGGVHSMSLKSRLENKIFYTQKDLKEMAQKYFNKSDQDIGGRYASTEVTNIALVLGTMKALGFNKVYPVRVGLVEGVLVSSN